MSVEQTIYAAEFVRMMADMSADKRACLTLEQRVQKAEASARTLLHAHKKHARKTLGTFIPRKTTPRSPVDPSPRE